MTRWKKYLFFVLFAKQQPYRPRTARLSAAVLAEDLRIGTKQALHKFTARSSTKADPRKAPFWTLFGALKSVAPGRGVLPTVPCP